ncbi:MAG TPA: protein kinase [Planctomycetota bacterium]
MTDEASPDETPSVASTLLRSRMLVPPMKPLPVARGSRRQRMVSVLSQDLSADPLLANAPRILAEGRPAPALGGIALLAKIGQGTTGAVYYGIHPRLKAEVAIKVLPFHLAEQEPETIQRFVREAQRAACVQSSNLVDVTDVNTENGICYLVMEFVSGKSAGAVLEELKAKNERGLSETVALDICIAASHGLAAAHQQNVLHRDIKPANILIPLLHDSDQLDFGAAKLADLGLALGDHIKQGQSSTDAVTGAQEYLPPESADAKSAGKPGDVLCLGATLHALLTGKPPEADAAVRSLPPEISQVTSALLERCLQKDPAARPADAHALLNALQACRHALGKPARTSASAAAAKRSRSKSSAPRQNVALRRPRTGVYLAAAAGMAGVLLLVLGLLAHLRETGDRAGAPNPSMPDVVNGQNDKKESMPVESSPTPPSSTSNAASAAVADPVRWKNAIDLMPLIDVQKDAVTGQWSVDHGELKLDKTEVFAARLQLPYRPGEEYDFRVEFTVRNGKPDVNQSVIGGGRAFVWKMGGHGGSELFGFASVAGADLSNERNPTAKRLSPLQLGQRHSSVVQVRKDGVWGYFDGQFVAQYKTDYTDMELPGWNFGQPDTKLLGLTAFQCSVLFHRIQILEVSGRGEAALRPVAPTGEKVVKIEGTWEDAEIGTSAAGKAVFETGRVTIKSGARNAASSSSAWHFLSQRLSGDVSIIARLASLDEDNPNSLAWAGLAFRESLDLSSSLFGIGCLSNKSVRIAWRIDGHTDFNYNATPWKTPCWLKIVRRGDLFTAFVSKDSQNWQQMGAGYFVSMSKDVFVGLTTTSGMNGESTSAAFDNVTVEQLDTLPQAGAVNDPERWKNAIDLLALLDLQKDVVEGQWSSTTEGPKMERGEGAVEFPYTPPGEYDLRVEFTRTSGTEGLYLLPFHSGNRFFAGVGHYKNTVVGLAGINNKGAKDNRTTVLREKWLTTGRRYSCVLEVRTSRVTLYLDGAKTTEWIPQYGTLRSDSRHVRSNRALGIGGAHFGTSILFHSAKLLEVAERGTFTRPDDPAAKEAEKKRSAATGQPRTQPVADAVQPAAANLNPATKVWRLHDGKEPIADYAKRVGLPLTETLDLGGGAKMEMMLVPAGEFMMGADYEGGSEEKPAHKVNITKPFYLAKYETTVAQFKAFADATQYVTEAERSGGSAKTRAVDGKSVGGKGVIWRTPGFPQEDIRQRGGEVPPLDLPILSDSADEHQSQLLDWTFQRGDDLQRRYYQLMTPATEPRANLR